MKSNIFVYFGILCAIILVVSWTAAAGRAQPQPLAAEDDNGRSINWSSIRNSSTTMSSSKKIVLKSSDGVSFEVEELVALESQTIKHMMTEDNYAENGILLPNVSSRIMPKVIEYCKRHVEAAKLSSAEGATDEKLKTFDAEFVKVDTCTLLDLFLAAYNLNITSLYDLTSQTIGDMMRGKTPQEIRKTFNIKNDFTIEEEEEVVRENAWAFE